LKQIVGLIQQSFQIPLPLNRFQEKEQAGGLVQQFGGDAAQAKLGIWEAAVFVIRSAVISLQPPDDF
jgi:hypothetical protein